MQNIQNDKLPVNEIFYSISGEGLSAGTPATFVRLAGCNLAEMGHACNYCDTSYAWDEKSSTVMTIDQIMSKVSDSPAGLVIITGGEPLKYNLSRFLFSLELRNLEVEIETNGTFPIWLGFSGRWSLDIKTPCAGNTEFNFYRNLRRLRERDQSKFIISDRKDFEFAKNIISQYPTKASVLLQPSWQKLDPAELVEWIKREFSQAIPPRLSLQLHKIIWGNKKGV